MTVSLPLGQAEPSRALGTAVVATKFQVARIVPVQRAAEAIGQMLRIFQECFGGRENTRRTIGSKNSIGKLSTLGSIATIS